MESFQGQEAWRVRARIRSIKRNRVNEIFIPRESNLAELLCDRAFLTLANGNMGSFLIKRDLSLRMIRSADRRIERGPNEFSIGISYATRSFLVIEFPSAFSIPLCIPMYLQQLRTSCIILL